MQDGATNHADCATAEPDQPNTKKPGERDFPGLCDRRGWMGATRTDQVRFG